MKSKHFLANITIAFASVLLIASCSKESPITHPQPGSYQPPKILNLVAGGWIQQSYTDIYVNPFLGILSNRGQAAVFLQGYESDIVLTSTPTRFLTGEIWITTTSSDLILNFRDLSGDPLPFSSLNIKVVFSE